MTTQTPAGAADTPVAAERPQVPLVPAALRDAQEFAEQHGMRTRTT